MYGTYISHDGDENYSYINDSLGKAAEKKFPGSDE
jgi:hypothetical protein